MNCKKTLKSISLILFIIITIQACKTQKITTNQQKTDAKKFPPKLTRLINQIDSIFKDSTFAHAHWGVLIKSLKTGETWYERDANRMYIPASNTKLPSGASTLLKLGPDFTYNTKVCINGTVEDSVLTGDLVVIGNGDPTLYTKFHEDSRNVFFSLADTLKKHGIKKIDGRIIGDDNLFDDNRLGFGWSYTDLDVWYSAEVNALQFNENYVDILITPPAKKDGKIKIEPMLESSYYKIINEIEVRDTGYHSIEIERPMYSNDIKLKGYVCAGSSEFFITPAIYNATMFYVTALKESLTLKGIEVTGAPTDCDDIDNWQQISDSINIITSFKSPPMKEMLAGMLKRSQNMYAETFVRTLGMVFNEKGTFLNGKKVVEQVLDSIGIKPKTYAYRDGSGLSRYNFFSPAQFVKIQTAMYNSKYKDVWYNSQTIAGVDGTLERRMKGTKAEGNVHGKTGTLMNVRALSGYVTTADGEDVVFSFLVNGHLLSSKDTEKLTDETLRLIAEFKR